MAIAADQVQAMGMNGAGVGVAIVDSGIDATHPDLAARVRHDMKMVDADLGVGPTTTPTTITKRARTR